MKLSANSVKADGSNPPGPPQLTYSQTAGFPTIAPAPTLAQSHGGMISTHQGQQFQVISSPPFATASPNPSNQYGIPQFATYNQQGQLVLSSPNFPGAATPYAGGQQIILTAAGQQAPPAPQQPQQANKATLKPAATSNAFVPMSQQPTGYTLGAGPTFMFAAAPNTTLTEPPQNNAPNNAGVVPKNEPPKAATAPQAVQAAAPQQATPQPTANSSNIIMHNGIAYMNPQHILSSSNGQIILRTHDHQQPQQIMLPPQPTPAPLRQAVAAAPPPKAPSRSLPPILPTTTTMVTRPLATTNIAAVSTTPYTLPQTPVSQAALTSSPKSSNSSGGKNSSGSHPKNSVLKSVQNHQRSTPPGVIMAASGGPPILSQQQPHTPQQQAVQLSQQPPTLQPMHTYTPPPPASSSMAPTTASHTTANTKVLSSSGKKNPVIKAAAPKSAPASTPPPSSDNSTPKAFVKPNVLTHVIDGHIIQESSSPFPLESSSSANSATTEEDEKPQAPGRVRGSKKEDESAPPSSAVSGSNNHPPQQHQNPTLSAASTNTTTTTKSSSSTTNSTNTVTHVEKKRGPGRPPGSTRQNIDSQRIPGSEGNNHNSKGGNNNHHHHHHHIKDGPPNEKRRKLEDPIIKPPPSAPANPVFGKNGGNPLKWSVQQVCDFVKSLHGCAEYVEDFMLQEIDGQALMLLKTEHLMAAMSIKLGPALKICSAINEMREEVKQQV